jgi:hypothetical protein
MLLPSIFKNHLAQLLPVLKPIAVQQVPPRTPFNLRVTGGAAGNALAWENVPAADGYEVQMSETGDFSSAPTVFSGNATAFADVHTTIGTKRWYRIRSYASTRRNSIIRPRQSSPPRGAA